MSIGCSESRQGWDGRNEGRSEASNSKIDKKRRDSCDPYERGSWSCYMQVHLDERGLPILGATCRD